LSVANFKEIQGQRGVVFHIVICVQAVLLIFNIVILKRTSHYRMKIKW